MTDPIFFVKMLNRASGLLFICYNYLGEQIDIVVWHQFVFFSLFGVLNSLKRYK